MDKRRRVLFVDDEQNILDSYKASLRKRFVIDTANGGHAGLEKIRNSGPYAVVVSDLKMPKMDGIAFLGHVRDESPDTVRVMLTGHADLDSAIDAVNTGEVFRFLTKPAVHEDMIRTLESAIKQYALVVSERELLRGTLRGCISVLTDILSMVSPEAFSKSERIKRLARKVAMEMSMKQMLYLDLATMLCQLGCITFTDTMLEKLTRGEELHGDELQTFKFHPALTYSMLSQIPRMDRVADIILHQQEGLDEFPEAPIESRILKVCLDYDALILRGIGKYDAVEKLRNLSTVYDLGAVLALERVTAGEEGYIRRTVPLDKLRQGMILDESLWSTDKVHLMAAGTELTETALFRVKNFMKAKRLPAKIRVMLPTEQQE